MNANQPNRLNLGQTYEVESSWLTHIAFGSISLGEGITPLHITLVAMANGAQYLYFTSEYTQDLVESMVVRHVENGDISVGQVFNTYLRHCDHHCLDVPIELPTSEEEEEEHSDPMENLPSSPAATRNAVTVYPVHSPFLTSVRIDCRHRAPSVYVTGLSGNEVRFSGFTPDEIDTLHALLTCHHLNPDMLSWSAIYSNYLKGRHG